MKSSFKYFVVIALVATIFSCKKDNYVPPSNILSGALLYNNDTIYLERNAVHFQLYQYGFGKVGPISTDETFAQNGTYSSSLFNGDYKLIVPNGDGPFIWKQTSSGVPDSVSITISGNQTVNLQVTPYYMISNAQIAPVGSDSVHATLSINKIVTDVNAKDIEYVALYVNKTQFVAGSSSIASVSVPAASITDMSNVQMGVKVPAVVPTQNYMFARIGLKMANIEDLIFSPLVKVNL